ncbi:MAG: hypothetical protein DSM107014_02525 [Gomphosphaeria aponina SAG 52.96 = DSM 107014]|uniref:Uncharacterized protein n=1 Tax=Gomphosphaeria aponina SAG 52.96 = DSM 107014 TaxID=1521640 RepID=A0A941GRN8_9CHRO|nr:hypothetical protein [Gomphosphaeria aponina SAG 52.96 = DSM 107014]
MEPITLIIGVIIILVFGIPLAIYLTVYLSPVLIIAGLTMTTIGIINENSDLAITGISLVVVPSIVLSMAIGNKKG